MGDKTILDRVMLLESEVTSLRVKVDEATGLSREIISRMNEVQEMRERVKLNLKKARKARVYRKKEDA